MRMLFVMRHGKSSWKDPSRDDQDRPLSERGKGAAGLMAEYIREHGIRPALVLSSPARRARETLDIVSKAFGRETRLVEDPRLYLASDRELLTRLREVPESAASVMILGHSPGIEVLADLLAGAGEKKALRKLRVKLPTASLAILNLPDVPWREMPIGEGSVAALVTPKRLEKDRGKKPAARQVARDYFDYYDGNRSYEESFKEYFDGRSVIEFIRLVWGLKPPFRLLDAGSANGLTLRAFEKLGVEAWGIENSPYIHGKTPRRLRQKNRLGDVCAMPFPDGFFDVVYETCLCHVPAKDLDRALLELHRVSRRGVLLGSIVRSMEKKLMKKQELDYNVTSFFTLEEWAERFRRAGFVPAPTDVKTLAKIWKIEEASNEGERWYPSAESMRLCFYSKAKASPAVPRRLDLPERPALLPLADRLDRLERFEKAS